MLDRVAVVGGEAHGPGGAESDEGKVEVGEHALPVHQRVRLQTIDQSFFRSFYFLHMILSTYILYRNPNQM